MMPGAPACIIWGLLASHFMNHDHHRLSVETVWSDLSQALAIPPSSDYHNFPYRSCSRGGRAMRRSVGKRDMVHSEPAVAYPLYYRSSL